MEQIGDTDTIRLSTGREIWANKGILGMTAGGELEIFEGYDSLPGWERELTPEERREIAVHMIQRWVKWAA